MYGKMAKGLPGKNRRKRKRRKTLNVRKGVVDGGLRSCKRRTKTLTVENDVDVLDFDTEGGRDFKQQRKATIRRDRGAYAQV